MDNKDDLKNPRKADEASRREFLIKAGKVALYVPPAMMVLMHTSRNASAGDRFTGGSLCKTQTQSYDTYNSYDSYRTFNSYNNFR